MRKFRFVEATKCVEQSDDGGTSWKKIAENYTKQKFHELWESGAGDIREDGKLNWVEVPGYKEKLKASEAAARSAAAGSKVRMVEAYKLLGLDQSMAECAAGIETALESKSLTAIAESFKQVVSVEAANKIAALSAKPDRRKKN